LVIAESTKEAATVKKEPLEGNRAAERTQKTTFVAPTHGPGASKEEAIELLSDEEEEMVPPASVSGDVAEAQPEGAVLQAVEPAEVLLAVELSEAAETKKVELSQEESARGEEIAADSDSEEEEEAPAAASGGRWNLRLGELPMQALGVHLRVEGGETASADVVADSIVAAVVPGLLPWESAPEQPAGARRVLDVTDKQQQTTASREASQSREMDTSSPPPVREAPKDVSELKKMAVRERRAESTASSAVASSTASAGMSPPRTLVASPLRPPASVVSIASSASSAPGTPRVRASSGSPSAAAGATPRPVADVVSSQTEAREEEAEEDKRTVEVSEEAEKLRAALQSFLSEPEVVNTRALFGAIARIGLRTTEQLQSASAPRQT